MWTAAQILTFPTPVLWSLGEFSDTWWYNVHRRQKSKAAILLATANFPDTESESSSDSDDEGGGWNNDASP